MKKIITILNLLICTLYGAVLGRAQDLMVEEGDAVIYPIDLGIWVPSTMMGPPH